MSEVEYHIHVNALLEELADVKAYPIEQGYSYKPAAIYVDGSPQYLGLYSLKPTSHQLRDENFNKALQFVQSHERFVGYVESESVSAGMVTEFPFRPFDSSQGQLAFCPPVMVSRPKSADVHVYMPINSPSDELSNFLLANQFYEVRTSSKKIFTLELESMVDAKKLYHLLVSFFQSCGGAIEVECETVGQLKAARPQHIFRNVAARGCTDETLAHGMNRYRSES